MFRHDTVHAAHAMGLVTCLLLGGNLVTPAAVGGEAAAAEDAGERAPAATQPTMSLRVAGTAVQHAERRILEILQQPTAMDFLDTSLKEATIFLSERHELPIVIDHGGLEDAGVEAEVPVTMSVEGISLESALQLMLEPLDLTYVIQHEVLLITNHDRAQKSRVIAVYPVGDLADITGDVETILEVVTNTIVPDSWEEVGGAGTIKSLGSTLVVGQTLPIHQEIERLLQALRTLSELEAASAAQKGGGFGGGSF